MFLESVSLTNFRCFGPVEQVIGLSSGLTAFVGANGSGKTALMHALLRQFGMTPDQRRVRRQDFHVPATESKAPSQRVLSIESILSFPELEVEAGDHTAVPEFFHQMAADDKGRLKCRLRLQATWVDDGSLDGAIEQKFWAVRTFGAFEETDLVELKTIDRSRVQMLYVPASRTGFRRLPHSFAGGFGEPLLGHRRSEMFLRGPQRVSTTALGPNRPLTRLLNRLRGVGRRCTRPAQTLNRSFARSIHGSRSSSGEWRCSSTRTNRDVIGALRI